MTQNPYLNLGCGKIHLPAERPWHHGLINEAIYSYPLWLNVDKIALPGVDDVVDIFTYPWPWADNAFDGALLSHIVEHIPHEIAIHTVNTWPHQPNGVYNVEKMAQQKDRLGAMQDGWYAFFSELYRVLTPGAMVYVLAPYGWSQGAITDPTHTRLITEHTFMHSMKPDSDGPFQYNNGGIHFEMGANPTFRVNELFQHLQTDSALLFRALATQINVAYEMGVELETIKNGTTATL